LCSSDHERRVVPQSCEAFDDPVAVARDAVPEHVAGEDDVTEGRVAACLLASMLIEACASVHEQDTWTHARQRFVPEQ